jgi:hypothetical protein
MVQIDDDVGRVLSFMQETLPADRLVPVASAVAGLAPALWGHFQASEVRTPFLLGLTPSSLPRQ